MARTTRTTALAGFAGLVLAGCSGTIPVTYTAQNFARFHGETDIGKFTYEPSTPRPPAPVESKAAPAPVPYGSRSSGSSKPTQVAPNQIQNTAIGSIYVAANIADLVQRATALELERTGVMLSESSPVAVSGDVLNFKADDLGWSVDWTYSVRYKITRKSDATVLLSRVYEADPKKTGKFGQAADYGPSVNEMVLSAYDKFIRDEDVRRLLAPTDSGKRTQAVPVPGA